MPENTALAPMAPFNPSLARHAFNRAFADKLCADVLALVPREIKNALALAGIPDDSWYVVGGAPLDVADHRTPSDLDIIFEGPPSLQRDRSDLLRTALRAQGFEVGATSLGGMRIRHPGQLQIDIWASTRKAFMGVVAIEVTGTAVRGDGRFLPAKGFWTKTTRAFPARFTVGQNSLYTPAQTAQWYIDKYRAKGYHVTVVEE